MDEMTREAYCDNKAEVPHLNDMSNTDFLCAAESPLPWQRLSGRNILVTGATGLIGSAVVRILMCRPDADYHVYALGRNEERFGQLFGDMVDTGRLHFIRHDVSEPLTGTRPYHYIIHAASGANPVVYSTDPLSVIRANLWGTDHLMRYGLSHGMERFVFVSSGDVYGQGDGRPFTEDYSGYVDPLQVRSCYTSSKRAAETICVSYAHQHGVDISIARPCHTYGPHFSPSDTRAYAQFLRDARAGRDIVMKSQGLQLRSWIYSVDCALGILYIALKGARSQAYNVADTHSVVPIRQLAEMIARAANTHVVIDDPNPTEALGYNPATQSTFDTTRLQSLGWQPGPGSMEEHLRQCL